MRVVRNGIEGKRKIDFWRKELEQAPPHVHTLIIKPALRASQTGAYHAIRIIPRRCSPFSLLVRNLLLDRPCSWRGDYQVDLWGNVLAGRKELVGVRNDREEYPCAANPRSFLRPNQSRSSRYCLDIFYFVSGFDPVAFPASPPSTALRALRGFVISRCTAPSTAGAAAPINAEA